MLEIFVPFLWVAFHYRHCAHKPAPEKDSASTETVSEEQTAENRLSLKIANCRPFVIPSCYIGDRGMILRNSLVEDRIKFEIERITSMLIILIHMDLAFDGYGFTNIWSVLIILKLSDILSTLFKRSCDLWSSLINCIVDFLLLLWRAYCLSNVKPVTCQLWNAPGQLQIHKYKKIHTSTKIHKYINIKIRTVCPMWSLSHVNSGLPPLSIQWSHAFKFSGNIQQNSGLNLLPAFEIQIKRSSPSSTSVKCVSSYMLQRSKVHLAAHQFGKHLDI